MTNKVYADFVLGTEPKLTIVLWWLFPLSPAYMTKGNTKGDMPNILWPDELGCPQTHLKSTMVRNLQLLLNRGVPTTPTNCYGLPKDWINEAEETYWTKLVQCSLHSDAP